MLFSQLPRDARAAQRPPTSQSSQLEGLASQDKRLFVTLHCLFPNELLSALDLLDRRLVTRLSQVRVMESQEKQWRESTVYYVRSAAQTTSRSRYQNTVYYEVRLSAWNCSCPAFIFATFSDTMSLESDPSLPRDTPSVQTEPRPCRLGGLSLGQGVPAMCKHLMACFLAEKCDGLFGSSVIDTTVSKEELAGWAAGWGG